MAEDRSEVSDYSSEEEGTEDYRRGGTMHGRSFTILSIVPHTSGGLHLHAKLPSDVVVIIIELLTPPPTDATQRWNQIRLIGTEYGGVI
ncbi:hypothetical protein LR48_Vigan07g018600 [Vigna angularis]|uniref:Uncharacterized protein n=1 Tax=Phaseolus angularis TaxID=3914 RepID=A0A0L9UV89_PHAAN|nr:hypothetical protein LR48_Vigan07g018600 [Vigna angularis]